MRYHFTVTPGILAAALVLAACGDSKRGETAEAAQPKTTDSVTVVPESPAPSAPSTGGVVTGPVSFEDANAAFRARRYAEAVSLFSAYTERRPENPWGHYLLGLSAWKAGDRDRAVAAFTRALELDSTHLKSHLNLSRVLLEQGNGGEALQHVQAALAIDSASSSGFRLLGRARSELGDPPGAIDAYTRAIVLDDRDAWSMNNLGLVLIEQGRFEEALGPLARAAQLDSTVAVFQNNLGIALERAGYFIAAAKAYRTALAADGSHTKASVNLTRVEGVQEGPAVGPIDLAAVAQAFVEQVQAWRDNSASVSTMMLE